ncbi:MAG: 16S rRNA (cytosine(1402)-N(4))-methyltransferase RsmH [Eggerthellaceae bacterium]|nr:16S rRNA (cytosine(1402)-N(4))-methyltransferase RsmH [Eggerthellaceae bacterium]
MTSEYRHIPVMLDECMEGLALKKGDVFVDATLGLAGHSVCAAKQLGREGILIGIDQDDFALEQAKERLDAISQDERPEVVLLKGNFGDMDDLLLQAELPGIDAVLFDLGVSSPQIDNPARGFSFKENAPLDMRMDPGKQTITAQEIINTLNEADLTRIIRANSDERWASRIASFIVRAREAAPIETTGQLVDIVKAAIPASARRRGGHPAKRTFQAIRMEVNQERQVLERGLDAAIRWLLPGGRIAVMSYHSIEDRIVKDTFARFANRCTCPPDLPVCACGKKPMLEVKTRKPICATPDEVEANPRSRSAKLRIACKL